MSEEADYKVGKGRPPKHTRFRRGQSGNPSGKKKGTRSLKADVDDELRAIVSITENGRPRKITKQQLLVKSTLAKAIKGDNRATQQIFELVHRHLGTGDEASRQDALPAEDQAILDAYFARRSHGDVDG